MKRFLYVVAPTLVLSAVATAQPYYIRGDFNGWSGTSIQMTEVSSGFYEALITGLSANQRVEFKATQADWTNDSAANVLAYANANGELRVTYQPSTTWNDGYLPNNVRRTGFYNTGRTYELMGSFNGWTTPIALTETSPNSGVFQTTTSIAAGSHEGKFRVAGDWNVSIGNNFGGGSNLTFTVANDNPLTTVTLDLKQGRYGFQPAAPVPEPATMAVVGLGLVAAARRRRK